MFIIIAYYYFNSNVKDLQQSKTLKNRIVIDSYEYKNYKVVLRNQTIDKIPETTKTVIKQVKVKNQSVAIKETNINYGFKSVIDAEEFYYNVITKNTINCSTFSRIGREVDGGWDVCFSGDFKLKNSDCLSYSFGVNYIWEFDDIIASKYNCIVRTFDPSMTKEPDQLQRPSKAWFYKIGLGKQDITWNNGWNIMKLSSILKRFNEQDKIIDILKIDIEFSEWDSFESIIQDGLLLKIKQIMFETHTEEVEKRTTSKESFIRFLRVWNLLYENGFRQWKNSWNHYGNYNSVHSGKARTCCYEHYLININYL